MPADISKATVSRQGAVTGISPGTVKISAIYEGAKGEIAVNILNP